MKLCVNCKNEIANEAKFCGHCGAKQEEINLEDSKSSEIERTDKKMPQVLLSAPAPKVEEQKNNNVLGESKAVSQVTDFVKSIEKERVKQSATQLKQNLFKTVKNPGFVHEECCTWPQTLLNYLVFLVSFGFLIWANVWASTKDLSGFGSYFFDMGYFYREVTERVMGGTVVLLILQFIEVSVLYVVVKHLVVPNASFKYVFTRFVSFLTPHTFVNIILIPFALLSTGTSVVMMSIIGFFVGVSFIIVPILVLVTKAHQEKDKMPDYYIVVMFIISLSVVAKILFEILVNR